MRSKRYLRSASWWYALELRLPPTEPMLLPNHFQEVYCIYFKSTGKDTDFQRTKCLPRISPVFFSSRLLSSWEMYLTLQSKGQPTACFSAFPEMLIHYGDFQWLSTSLRQAEDLLNHPQLLRLPWWTPYRVGAFLYKN